MCNVTIEINCLIHQAVLRISKARIDGVDPIQEALSVPDIRAVIIDCVRMKGRAQELLVSPVDAAAKAQSAVMDGLPVSDPAYAPKKAARDVFVYFIHEAKVRAPAAAMALIERVDK